MMLVRLKPAVWELTGQTQLFCVLVAKLSMQWQLILAIYRGMRLSLLQSTWRRFVICAPVNWLASIAPRDKETTLSNLAPDVRCLIRAKSSHPARQGGFFFLMPLHYNIPSQRDKTRRETKTCRCKKKILSALFTSRWRNPRSCQIEKLLFMAVLVTKTKTIRSAESPPAQNKQRGTSKPARWQEVTCRHLDCYHVR